MAEATLFDDPVMTSRPDPARRKAVRRQVLGGILQVIRARRAWSVTDAASQAGIAPMTWRRLEDGLEVRQRTLTALDGLLGQSFGTVRRALDDDGALAHLVALTGVDTPPVDPDEIGPYLDALAERLRTGTVTGSATANLGGAHQGPRTATGTGRAALALGPLGFGTRKVETEEPSTITLAAQLVDRLTRGPMTEAIEHAVASILAAMPDLVRGGDMRAAAPAVDVLSGSSHPTLHQAAAELAQQATEEAIAQQRSGDRR